MKFNKVQPKNTTGQADESLGPPPPNGKKSVTPADRETLRGNTQEDSANNTATSPTAGELKPTAAHPNIEYTIFTAPPDGRLTKEFKLDGDGEIQVTGTPVFVSGIARAKSISYVTDLEQMVAGLGPNECISTGIFDRPYCEVVLSADLTEDRLNKGMRARTGEHMKQPNPGLVLLDYDPSSRMPEHMLCDSPADLMDKLASLSPLLEGIGYSGAASASNGIINLKTGEAHTKNGFHCYILTNETDLRVLRDWLRAKCWAAGFGYIDFGRNGVKLERCIVDATVFSPERLIYEADPVLGEGLERPNRSWTHQAGRLLAGDFRVSHAEDRAYKKALDAAKNDPDTVTESRRIYDEYYELKCEERAEIKAIAVDEAKRRWPREGPPHEIAASATLYWDDTVYINGNVISVEQLVAQGEALDRTPMPDPVEGPSYGSATAMFFYNGGRQPVIHSFAHGVQVRYSIKSHRRLAGIEAAEALDVSTFPHTRVVKGELVPRATIANLRHLLECYGILVYYNVITKRLDIRIPGLQGTPDNIDNSALSHIISLCLHNNMSVSQVPHYLAAIGDQAQYNPVTEWVSSKVWDGKDRLEAFYATLTTRGNFPVAMKCKLMFRWLVSAIAAAFLPSGFRARGVLVLQGAQSMGKTSWVMKLVPNPMLREILVKIDHHLDAANKDSQTQAISHWIVEFGELESTMKRDIPRLKGFITADSDKLRLPYARRESTYPRRTVFCATVNREDFLSDDTGNTRWWTLPLIEIHFNHDIDMQQLWAQVYHLYQTEKPEWWLTSEEERQLESLNKAHRSTSSIRQLIEAGINFKYQKHWQTCPVVNATTILQSLGKQNPSNTEAKECAAVMREQLGDPIKSNGLTGWRIKLPDHT